MLADPNSCLNRFFVFGSWPKSVGCLYLQERFVVKVDGNGDGYFTPIENHPKITILPNAAKIFHVTAPSYVMPHKPFKVRTAALDYGDNWVVMVTVEKVVAKRGARRFVRCTHGRRAGPPEDIGGPVAYEELVDAMKTRRGSNYRHWRELNGGIFDPAAFDLEETNRALDHSVGG